MAGRNQCKIQRPLGTPCPASCNPCSPKVQLENDFARVTFQISETEKNYTAKLTECAALKAEVLEKKDEIKSERDKLEHTLDRVRQLEMKLEGFSQRGATAMPSREEERLREERARHLSDKLAETRRELSDACAINNIQQSYRAWFLQAELKGTQQERLLHCMQVDNARIRHQINQEIMRVKLKFQEQLQQLEPLPELLRSTEARLKVAFQKQAEAEHNAESIAREVNCARDKLVKLSEKPPPEQIKVSDDEERINSLNQRIQQIASANSVLEAEIEKLKANCDLVADRAVISKNQLIDKQNEHDTLIAKVRREETRMARSVKNSERRADTVRECLKAKVAQLEQQLVEVRARLAAIGEEREELKIRMQGETVRLLVNLKQAHGRISQLQAQVLRLHPPPPKPSRQCTTCSA